MRERLDGLRVTASKHRFGDAAAEPGAGECGQLALPVRRRPAKRSEPAPAGESARRGDVGIGGLRAKTRDCLGCDRGRNPLACQPRANHV
jgi:hypothetical protein